MDIKKCVFLTVNVFRREVADNLLDMCVVVGVQRVLRPIFFLFLVVY